jgi:hypothetical protein
LKDYCDVTQNNPTFSEGDICNILKTRKPYKEKYGKYNIHSLRKIVRAARDPTKNILLRHIEMRNIPLQLIREHFDSKGIAWDKTVQGWGSLLAETWVHLIKMDGDVQPMNKTSDDRSEDITTEALREFIRRSGEFVLELDTGKWKCSSKAKLLLGLDKNEGERLSSWKRVVPDHVSQIQAAVDEAANTGQFRVDFLVEHTNESLNWISATECSPRMGERSQEHFWISLIRIWPRLKRTWKERSWKKGR